MSISSRRESTDSARPPASSAELDHELGHAPLHPALQGVLDSLHVDLEDELARYRHHVLLRQRASRLQSPAATAASLALGQMEPSEKGIVPSSSISTAIEAASAETSLVKTESTPDEAGIEDSLLDEESLPDDLTAIDFERAVAEAVAEADGVVDMASISGLASELGEQEYRRLMSDDASSSSDLVAVQGQDVDAALETGTSELAVTYDSVDDVAFLPSTPDDYLESSEELLRSLEDEQQRAAAIATEDTPSSDQRLWSTLVTPLGMGSILLLILSSTTLGYLVMRPSTLQLLTFWRSGEDAALDGSRSNVAPRQQGGLPNLAPDLASGEFDPIRASNLSSLPGVTDSVLDGAEEGLNADGLPNNGAIAAESDGESAALQTNNGSVSPTRVPSPSVLGTLPAAPPRSAPPRPAPRATPSTPAPVAPAAPASPSSAAAPQEPAAPAPSSATVEGEALNFSEPNAAPSTNAATTPPSESPQSQAAPSSQTGTTPVSATPVQDGLYYVTTPYTGDQSLESARQAVSGSYLRNFPEGTQVQMGAFSDPSRAEILIQELESQGISAEIYREE